MNVGHKQTVRYSHVIVANHPYPRSCRPPSSANKLHCVCRCIFILSHLFALQINMHAIKRLGCTAPLRTKYITILSSLRAASEWNPQSTDPWRSPLFFTSHTLRTTLCTFHWAAQLRQGDEEILLTAQEVRDFTAGEKKCIRKREDEKINLWRRQCSFVPQFATDKAYAFPYPFS